MPVTDTKSRNQTGAAGVRAKTGPRLLEKDRRIDTITVSADLGTGLRSTSRSSRDAQSKASFEKSYGLWLAEQNHRFEAFGLWSDEYRTW